MSDQPPAYDDGLYSNTYQPGTFNSSSPYFSSGDPIYSNTTNASDAHPIYTVVNENPNQSKTRPFFGFIHLEDGICKSPVLPAERGRAYFLLLLCMVILPGLFIAYVVNHFITTSKLKITWLTQVADVAVAAQMSYFSFVGQATGVSILSQVSGFSYVSMASIFSFYSMVSLVSCGSLFSFFSLHPRNGVCLWRIRNPYYWTRDDHIQGN